MDADQRPGLPAPFGARLKAAAIDALVLCLVGGILGLAFGAHLGRAGSLGRLIGLPFAVAYLGLAGSRLGGGQTAGKSFSGLKVVGADGQPLGIAPSLVRAALLTAPWFFNGLRFLPGVRYAAPLVIIAGVLVFGVTPASLVLVMALPRRRQFLHDLVVGSFVIREEQEGVPAGPPPRRAIALAATWVLAVTVVSIVLTTRALSVAPVEDPLAAAFLRIPGITNFTVTPMEVSQNGRHFRALRVVVSTSSGAEDAATLVRRAGAAVVAFHPELNQFAAIQVQSSSGFDVGLASWNTGATETRSPEEWRTALEADVNALLHAPLGPRDP